MDIRSFFSKSSSSSSAASSGAGAGAAGASGGADESGPGGSGDVASRGGVPPPSAASADARMADIGEDAEKTPAGNADANPRKRKQKEQKKEAQMATTAAAKTENKKRAKTSHGDEDGSGGSGGGGSAANDFEGELEDLLGSSVSNSAVAVTSEEGQKKVLEEEGGSGSDAAADEIEAEEATDAVFAEAGRRASLGQKRRKRVLLADSSSSSESDEAEEEEDGSNSEEDAGEGVGATSSSSGDAGEDTATPAADRGRKGGHDILTALGAVSTSKADAEGEGDDEASASTTATSTPAPQASQDARSKFTTQRSFDPLSRAASDDWKAGAPVPYLAVARTFSLMEATTKRLEITELLTQLFRSVLCLSPDDLLAVVYLCTNQLGPHWEGLKLEIGESILQKAIAETTGRTLARVKEEYETLGDLGLLAEKARGTQRTMFRPQPLSVPGVLAKFTTIAKLSGTATQQKKRDLIKGMLVACREQEARFVIRSLQGKLRIGLAEKTVIAALAHASVLSPPKPVSDAAGESTALPERIPSVKLTSAKLERAMTEANESLRSVFSECPNFSLVCDALQRWPVEKVHEHLKLSVGSPVNPMLAQPTKGVAEVCDRLQGRDFACEYKYDGERAQIHLLEDGSVRIFSRNLEEHTTKYPDIIASVPRVIRPATPADDDTVARVGDREELLKPATSFILDCEAVAWDAVDKKILPFQVLSTRAKKNVEAEDVKVRVCLFAFDLLYLNGTSLLKDTFRTRRSLMQRSFLPVEGEFAFAIGKDSNDPDEIQDLLEKAVADATEGLMVKTLDKEATYEPSRRSYSWLKVKKDYLEGMGDSLDLIVIGAFYGKGKRTGVYGGYLLACYDDEDESYQSICRIGTGFSDEDLTRFTAEFKSHVIPKPRSYYSYDKETKLGVPDVWLDGTTVFEVLCADMSISPRHKAASGLVDPNKGIALRFPRFIRERTDKTAEQATSAEQVADMYRAQAVVGGGSANGPPTR